MAYIDQLIEQFPVRKSRAQKKAFRQWALEEAKRLGYEAREEGDSFSTNVVVGDPDKAQVIVTAHYDTPAVMPIPNFITPCNVLIYLLYQLVVVGLMLGAMALVVAVSAMLGMPKLPAIGLGYVVVLVLCGLMMFGPANKHNANDNTSGTAAVLETMARLSEDQRAKMAFVLFDNEEKGMMGSSAFAGAHKAVKKETLLVNMDCVGLGEDILFFAPRLAREHQAYPTLEKVLTAQEGRAVHFFKMEGKFYPSDQSCFKRGVAVCSCKKGKVIGYYCDRIHTPADTIADPVNISVLADGLCAFAQTL